MVKREKRREKKREKGEKKGEKKKYLLFSLAKKKKKTKKKYLVFFLSMMKWNVQKGNVHKISKKQNTQDKKTRRQDKAIQDTRQDTILHTLQEKKQDKTETNKG